MTLPYSSATSGDKAIAEMQKILRAFGCTSFGHMLDFERGELLVQFAYRGRQVSVRASADGYAAAWLRENPWNTRRQGGEQAHKRRAKEIGSTAVYSIVRDWIKGQITAIETGVLSFEGAFLGSILLADGRTLMDRADDILPALPAPATTP